MRASTVILLFGMIFGGIILMGSLPEYLPFEYMLMITIFVLVIVLKMAFYND